MPLQKHLVVHLQEMYATERDYQNLLQGWSNKIQNSRLKSLVDEQIDGINQQMSNLKQCMSSLRSSPKDLPSAFVQALRREDRMTTTEMSDMTPQDTDAHIALTDVSFGQMEIGKYQGMVNMAKTLERQDVVDRLQQNLDSEQQDVRKMQRLLPSLLQESQQGAQPQARRKAA